MMRAIAVSTLTWLTTGCAHDSEWLQRQPGVESTIGTDFNKAPAGRVIPPAGLGVDLSDQSHDGTPLAKTRSSIS